jgi:CheY-like chemotaxis protein
VKKILLVNHTTAFLAKEAGILDRVDLRIFTAGTAEEALRIHREELVDLLIAELDLPDLAGDVLCSRIRQEETLQNVSVIIVCSDTPEEIARTESCGANAHLLKPVAPGRLSESVTKFLGVLPRRDYRVVVRVQVYGVRGNATLFCTSYNISVSGLLIEADSLLAQGDRLSVMFFLPGSCQISAVGEVVRTEHVRSMQHHYGIRFISMSPQHQAEIENFVAANTMPV